MIKTEIHRYQKIVSNTKKGEKKAIPVTGLGGLWGYEMLRISHSRIADGGEFVSLTSQPHCTHRKHIFSISDTHFC
jgi:hypothetical protein